MAKGFKILKGTGFHMTFENEYTVSVQFGPNTYSDNRNLSFYDRAPQSISSTTAEVAVFDPEGNFYPIFTEGPVEEVDIKGWCTPEEVLDLLNRISKLTNTNNGELE